MLYLLILDGIFVPHNSIPARGGRNWMDPCGHGLDIVELWRCKMASTCSSWATSRDVCMLGLSRSNPANYDNLTHFDRIPATLVLQIMLIDHLHDPSQYKGSIIKLKLSNDLDCCFITMQRNTIFINIVLQLRVSDADEGGVWLRNRSARPLWEGAPTCRLVLDWDECFSFFF
jgi:hypothetical protein